MTHPHGVFAKMRWDSLKKELNIGTRSAFVIYQASRHTHTKHTDILKINGYYLAIVKDDCGKFFTP